jgi:hypothetical protein
LIGQNPRPAPPFGAGGVMLALAPSRRAALLLIVTTFRRVAGADIP